MVGRRTQKDGPVSIAFCYCRAISISPVLFDHARGALADVPLLRETILAERHRVKSGRSGRDVVI